MARIILGPAMSIQAPPNLNPGRLKALVDAGINDWGGVSPLTPDHVNPESPWPQLDALARETRTAGKQLEQRLTIYPRYSHEPETWLDEKVYPYVLKLSDGVGLAREDQWLSGQSVELPDGFFESTPQTGIHIHRNPSSGIEHILTTALKGNRTLREPEIASLFDARGDDFRTVCQAADHLREEQCGNVVTYVVNRNINYTNICTYRCNFCAFAKGRKRTEASDAPYLRSYDEIADLTREAWQRGATEVCLQGGIHPSFTGQTYIDICATVKEAVPDIHVHAFSPLEVTHGATSLGLSLKDFLSATQRRRPEYPARHRCRDFVRRHPGPDLPRQN